MISLPLSAGRERRRRPRPGSPTPPRRDSRHSPHPAQGLPESSQQAALICGEDRVPADRGGSQGLGLGPSLSRLGSPAAGKADQEPHSQGDNEESEQREELVGAVMVQDRTGGVKNQLANRNPEIAVTTAGSAPPMLLRPPPQEVDEKDVVERGVEPGEERPGDQRRPDRIRDGPGGDAPRWAQELSDRGRNRLGRAPSYEMTWISMSPALRTTRATGEPPISSWNRERRVAPRTS